MESTSQYTRMRKRKHKCQSLEGRRDRTDQVLMSYFADLGIFPHATSQQAARVDLSHIQFGLGRVQSQRNDLYRGF